jgi:hypothetical protein
MTFIPYHQNGHVFDGLPSCSPFRPDDCLPGEDELSQIASSIGAFRDAEISGPLDFPHMNDPADLNLVPWMNLPRRAKHRNEQSRPFSQ